MRAILAVLLLLALAFAGCASKENGNDDDPSDTGTASGTNTGSSSSTRSGTGASSSTGTSSGSPQDNRAPAISITLAAGQSATGAAPLNVTFVLNGTDADGDDLTWTLAFGDASADTTGTSLPATENHTFSAGNHTVVFVVSDGTASVNATYVINATAAGGGNVPAPIVFSGESAHYGMLGCGAATPGFATYHDFDVALAGVWKFKASPNDMVTEWWVGDASSTDAGAEGVIPANHDNVAVCPAGTQGFAYPAESYTLTLYHPDGPVPA